MTTSSRIVQLLITLQSIFFLCCIPFLGFSLETDTITTGLFIKDPDTIVSLGHAFKLGFFSPKNSTNRYLGVFFNVSEETVIWVANRDKPLNDSSASVTISQDGNLVLINSQNQTVWSTSATTTNSPTNTSLQIQDTGNLVLRDNATGATIWESFSYPSNVYVPTMRTSDNIYTGKKVDLSSWKNESDPQVGSFTSGIRALNIPENVIWKNGRLHWRSGPWNGQIFIGIKEMYSATLSTATIANDSAGNVYFTIPLWRFYSIVVLNSSGTLVQSLWDERQSNWVVSWLAPETECDVYGKCGPFGSCNNQDSPICSCLRGFEPTNLQEWGRGNWTSGCRRIKQLQCNQTSGDGFFPLQFMKVPDFAEQFPARKEEECRTRCLTNCSCIAYAYESNIGCMFWGNTLIDIQKFGGVGVDLYLRLSASDFGHHKDRKLFIIIPVVVGLVAIVAIIFIAWYWKIKRRGEQENLKKIHESGPISSSDPNAILLKDESQIVSIQELPLFTFEMLANATHQFHDNNLLGKGGFGSVYKGKLANGEEIAVKRLAVVSAQGIKEFMNEVIVICKLQHRNLVRLLGCCVEKEEKMLVYEYMPNKSLDVHLFDPTPQSQDVLDWKKRFNIIEGIGRGLLYLHRDSRLRIIHRDLKPSNVLLDKEWNPKISDFGMARIFGGNEDHANTVKVAGTYGYIAPEYAMEGRFSEKSDVYSFGVLMLEIIKGKRNAQYYNHEWSLSLLGCGWKLWSEGNGLAFVDETIANQDFREEIIRCIHIALLCVQESPKDRPSIQTVLSMLSCEIMDLPAPEQPVFAEKWNRLANGSTQTTSQFGYSINELSHTMLDGR